MELDHVNIAVPAGQLEALRDFYCAVLGLEVGARPAFDRRGYWLYGTAGSACVHLIESDRHRRHETPGHLDHVAFRATDLAGTRRRLDAAGIAYRVSRIPELDLTQLFLHDPAGVRVELGFRGEGA
jgi:catechol 2,3-dioxygenase-like lactoylglutathione lyase family enzyme